ncbi:MAG: D-aminoacyl-tRNA deacylase [Burkholderiales bacterium]
MIALLQRVIAARVVVDSHVIGSIGAGLLVLVGVESGDTAAEADRLLDRLLDYRVFNDEAGKMNLSLRQIHGGLLLVPQFTLAAETRKGLRPGFSSAATPEEGKALFEHMVVRARQADSSVAQGKFGAHMQVSLTNDGPVTFWLQMKPGA